MTHVKIIFFIIEIIKEVTTNGDNLTELLHVSVEDLEPLCLERALKAAVVVGNHFNVGKLVVKGATNIQEALSDSKQLKKHEVRAMLLLIIAAQTNDRDLVLKLFGTPTQKATQHVREREEGRERQRGWVEEEKEREGVEECQSHMIMIQ